MTRFWKFLPSVFLTDLSFPHWVISLIWNKFQLFYNLPFNMLLWLVFYSMELRKKKGILSGHIQSYLYGRGLIPTCRYTRWIPAFQVAGQLPRARPFHPDTLTISITAPQEAATILQFLFWETMWLWVFFPNYLKNLTIMMHVWTTMMISNSLR